ncbi:MAG: cupin domain-containing protein [Rhodothermales bacterium]
MPTVIRSNALVPSPGGTILFEGGPHGANVSFFLVDNEPGAGPALHVHPYPETWIVREGRARFTVDGEVIEAGAGDIVVVEAETPHRFKNIGEDRLEIICIHPSNRVIQRDLETERPEV